MTRQSSTGHHYDTRTSQLLDRLGSDVTQQDYADLALACADKAGLTVSQQVRLLDSLNGRSVQKRPATLRLVADSDTAPERRYTEHLDNPGVCMFCGHRPAAHQAAACPHTVDSLTYEQVEQWLADGGSLATALDASPRLRIRLRDDGIQSVRTPTREATEAARRKIVDEMNAERLR